MTSDYFQRMSKVHFCLNKEETKKFEKAVLDANKEGYRYNLYDFLAPPGAQEVALCMCLSVCDF